MEQTEYHLSIGGEGGLVNYRVFSCDDKAAMLEGSFKVPTFNKANNYMQILSKSGIKPPGEYINYTIHRITG